MIISSIQKALIIALLGMAALAANKVGGVIAWAGICYYLACTVAILLKPRLARLMIWAAVGTHAILVSYSLYLWQTQGAMPCRYCFTAASLALTAGVFSVRPVFAMAPLVLAVTVFYAWNTVFPFGAVQTGSPAKAPPEETPLYNGASDNTIPQEDGNLPAVQAAPAADPAAGGAKIEAAPGGAGEKKAAPAEVKATPKTNGPDTPAPDKQVNTGEQDNQGKDAGDTAPKPKDDSG